MRLIDADKLINELNDAIKRKGLNTEAKNKALWCAWFLDIIAQVSTVDAIPIEWLRQFDYTIPDIIEHLIVLWRREQEQDNETD